MTKQPIGYIYLTTCNINGKIYVGKHELKEGDDCYLGSGTLFKRAVKKYGKENFKRKIICKIETDDVSKVRKLEKIYIKKVWYFISSWIQLD